MTLRDPAPPARRLAELIDRGALTPDTLARTTVEGIAADASAGDAAVRAFACTLDADAAAAQATRLRGPLRGVPVAVKDIFDTRDLPTGYGSAIYPARPAAVDAAIVAAVRVAGGLVVGKSTTTEFAFLHPTATRNPRAPGRTPGGSSAGSAAAVAAGLVPLAVGTQTGGSVIRPASYCGVVGYKPSFGWLPTPGLKPFSWSLDTVGLFARDIADVAWFAHALAARALAVDDAPAAGRCVVGVPDGYPWGSVSDSAADALAHGRRALKAAEVDTVDCSLPAWAAEAFAAHGVIQGYEAARCLRWELDTHGAELSPILREYLTSVLDIDARDYEAAQHAAVRTRAQADAWLRGVDVLMTPSAPDEAPEGYDSTGPSTFNRLWSLLGVPCISVPGAVGRHGAPMGLQLIAPYGEDARLLHVARRLEAALAGAR